MRFAGGGPVRRWLSAGTPWPRPIPSSRDYRVTCGSPRPTLPAYSRTGSSSHSFSGPIPPAAFPRCSAVSGLPAAPCTTRSWPWLLLSTMRLWRLAMPVPGLPTKRLGFASSSLSDRRRRGVASGPELARTGSGRRSRTGRVTPASSDIAPPPIRSATASSRRSRRRRSRPSCTPTGPAESSRWTCGQIDSPGQGRVDRHGR